MASVHKALTWRKHYLDTCGNGANHANDYLHRIYAGTDSPMRMITPIAWT